MRPRIIVYRSELLAYSETFIVAQTGAMRCFEPVFAGARRVDRSLALPGKCVIACEGADLPAKIRRQALRLAGRAPAFVSALAAHKPVLLHAHFATDAAEALPVARALGTPMVVTLHGYDVMAEDREHRRSLRGRVYLARRKQLFKEARLFFCVSEAIRQKAIARGFPPERLRVQPIGVDLERFCPPQQPRPSPVVLFVGRLVEKKGCVHLLRAMGEVRRAVPGAELVVVGNGPERSRLESVASVHAPGTRFVGVQNSEQVRAWMTRARVLAVPSITAGNGDGEGLPTVLYEALAMGLPVAAFRHSGIPELVVHEQAGLLAAEGDEAALASNLVRICTEDALAVRLGSEGRARVEQSFGLAAQTRVLESIYSEVIEHSSPDAPAAKEMRPERGLVLTAAVAEWIHASAGLGGGDRAGSSTMALAHRAESLEASVVGASREHASEQGVVR